MEVGHASSPVPPFCLHGSLSSVTTSSVYTSYEKESSMKKFLVLILGAAVSAQAALIHFDLSPPGTDVAVGLSPSNQVPPVTNSTGSGNTISGGIVLDTDSDILHLAIGYGSAAGFTDLTGVPIGMHIHSPAPTTQNAGVIVPLGPYSFPAQNPTNGGVII